MSDTVSMVDETDCIVADRLANALQWCRRRAIQRRQESSRMQRVEASRGGGGIYISPSPTLSLNFPLIALTLLLSGCASAEVKADRVAWNDVCENAPYGAGQSISVKEQRAMDRLDLWKVSVEELNARCQSRK